MFKLNKTKIRKYFIVFLLSFIAVILYLTVYKITEQDNTGSPTYTFHTPQYIKDRYHETGVKDIVNAIIINYRSMDTLGGVIILLTSIISVSSLLRSSLKDIVKMEEFIEDTILKTIVIFVTPFCLLFSFYIFYFGDEYPGGGFQAGLMLGATLIVISVGLGYKAIEKKISINTKITAVCVSAIIIIFLGLLGIFFGQNLFSYYFPEVLGIKNAEIFRYVLVKIFNLSIAILIGMIVTSLFFIMTGEDS